MNNLPWRSDGPFATVRTLGGSARGRPRLLLRASKALLVLMNDKQPAPSSFAAKPGWAVALAAVLALTANVGCHLWPSSRDKTSVITPAMRMASIREFGPRGRDADAAEQARICEQLAQQIRTEPDPIVRKTIQETIGEFNTPLANAVILAGLNDDDRDVRVTCCRLLG